MGIEGGTETVDKVDRAEAGRGSGDRTVRTQALLDGAQERARGGYRVTIATAGERAPRLEVRPTVVSFSG